MEPALPVLHYHRCPICGGKELYSVLLASDHTVSGESFPVWGCETCTGRFTQNVPVETRIGAYYQSESYISHSDTRRGLVNTLYHWVRSYTLTQKRTLIERLTGKRTGALLDYGCGTGAFLHEMATRGWAVHGLEPSPDAREFARNQYGLEVKSSDALKSFAPSSMDVITLWHVLEHVHQLHETVETLAALLKPEGVLLVAVPNFTSPDAAHYQEYWAAYDVPRHLYHFSPEAMSQLMVAHRLHVKQLHAMPFDSFYVSMLSEKYRRGSMNLFSAFRRGFSSWWISLRQQQKGSSILYEIRKAEN